MQEHDGQLQVSVGLETFVRRSVDQYRAAGS